MKSLFRSLFRIVLPGLFLVATTLLLVMGVKETFYPLYIQIKEDTLLSKAILAMATGVGVTYLVFLCKTIQRGVAWFLKRRAEAARVSGMQDAMASTFGKVNRGLFSRDKSLTLLYTKLALPDYLPVAGTEPKQAVKSPEIVHQKA